MSQLGIAAVIVGILVFVWGVDIVSAPRLRARIEGRSWVFGVIDAALGLFIFFLGLTM